ncbi:MAG: NAD(P)-dependent oxidoreductase [Verrucomicrobiales bacterium]|nr:NAD(P)-dependent oxidoreductase [Verrucomicrobiales bacterium]
MAVANQEVAVLGAASWVGQEVCRRLVSAGWNVTAVTRPKSALIVERLPVRVRKVGDPAVTSRYPVVVNLAFPLDYGAADPRGVNQALKDEILRLAEPGARILHFSTLAVFGLAVDRPIQVGPVPRWRDHEYAELKREMEHLLAKEFANQELHLLRLGNVWGPGSVNWVVGPVSRLRTGQPTAVRGSDGYSNVTDIANVADYAAHVLSVPRGRGLHVHHLAEFAERRWSEFIGFLARELGLAPVAAPPPPALPSGLGAEMWSGTVLAINAARRAWWDGRQSGSVYRQMRRWVPDAIRHLRPAKAAEDAGRFRVLDDAPPSDANLLRLLACPNLFKTAALSDWQPPVDFEASIARVSAWLREAGYVSESGISV